MGQRETNRSKGEGLLSNFYLFSRQCSECPVSANYVEKQHVAGAESDGLNVTQALSLSGFVRLLRCWKDFGQFAEVLGSGGEEEFVICSAWTT